MIDLKLNEEGQLTDEAKERVQLMMSELAQKCLVAISTITAEDLHTYNNGGAETDNVRKVKTLLEDIVVEADVPVIFMSSLAGELKLVATLVQSIEHAFVNAQNIVALDAMGKTKETEVSTKDVRDAYNKVVSKRVQDAVREEPEKE
jgi:hypothetical protein